MVAAIKQHVTVGPDGTIVVRDTALAPGTRTEVIVLVEESLTGSNATSPPKHPPDPFITALDALQASVKLDRATADKWLAEIRELRQWNRPRE